MKKSVLFALASGAVIPLVAAAVLAVIMPSLGTWAVVVGIAVVAGAFSAWAGHERYQLLASVRERIDAGTQTTIKALGEARKETRVARSEADKALAEQIERFFEDRGKRDEEWRKKTLIEWGKTTSDVQEVLKSLVEDLREHFTSTLDAEREALSHSAELRTEAILAEVQQAHSEFEQLSAATKDAVERHAAVIQATTEAMACVEEHLDKQRANEAESRQAALAEWQAVTKELDASFVKMLLDIRSHLEALSNEERALQEQAAKSRAEAMDAELARMREIFECAAQGIATAKKLVEDSGDKLDTEAKKAIEDLRELIKTEAQRQQEQNRADLVHFQKMLEVQRKAHEDASEHSGQLWKHLLD